MKHLLLVLTLISSASALADRSPPTVVSCGTESCYVLLRHLGDEFELKQVAEKLEKPAGQQISLREVDKFLTELGYYTLAVRGSYHRYGRKMAIGAIGHLSGRRYPEGHFFVALSVNDGVHLFVPPNISRRVSIDELNASPSNDGQIALLVFDSGFKYYLFKLVLRLFPNQILLRFAAYILALLLALSLFFKKGTGWRMIQYALLFSLTATTVLTIWATARARRPAEEVLLSVEPERIALKPGRAHRSTSFSFIVKNESDREVKIASLKSSCPCIEDLQTDVLTILPSMSAEVRGTYKYAEGGSKTSLIYVMLEGRDSTPATVEIIGNVIPPFRYDRSRLICTGITKLDLPLQRKIRVVSSPAVGDDSLRPISVWSSVEWIHASVSEPSLIVVDGEELMTWDIDVMIGAAPDRGQYSARLLLKTSSSEQIYEEITFPVIAEFL